MRIFEPLKLKEAFKVSNDDLHLTGDG